MLLVPAEPPAFVGCRLFGRSFAQPLVYTRNCNRAERVGLCSRPKKFTSGRFRMFAWHTATGGLQPLSIISWNHSQVIGNWVAQRGQIALPEGRSGIGLIRKLLPFIDLP